MKVLNKTLLTDFIKKHNTAKNSINKWLDIVESNVFLNHNELKTVFPSADYVGNGRYVFNIKGNRYRLVVLIVFANGYFRIKFCGTHADYDKIKNIENI